MLFEVIFFIPRADNDGASFPEAEFTAFAAFIAGLGLGVTRVDNAGVSGLWAEAGRLYSDDHMLFVVALGTIGQGGLVITIAHEAARRFTQESIYARYLGVSEIIYPPKKE